MGQELEVRRNRPSDERARARGVDQERAVVLGQAFVEPKRQAIRHVVDDQMHILVKDGAQHFIALAIGERDDVHVVAREEVAAERDWLAVVAGDVRCKGPRRAKDYDDRGDSRGPVRAGNHAPERVPEALELLRDLAHAAFAGFTVNDEVGRLDAHPLGGPGRGC